MRAGLTAPSNVSKQFGVCWPKVGHPWSEPRDGGQVPRAGWAHLDLGSPLSQSVAVTSSYEGSWRAHSVDGPHPAFPGVTGSTEGHVHKRTGMLPLDYSYRCHTRFQLMVQWGLLPVTRANKEFKTLKCLISHSLFSISFDVVEPHSTEE